MGIIATVAGIEWNMVGKCKVSCDVCKDVYDTGVWSFPNAEQRAKLADALRTDGWLVTGDHERHVCPLCVIRAETARLRARQRAGLNPGPHSMMREAD